VEARRFRGLAITPDAGIESKIHQESQQLHRDHDRGWCDQPAALLDDRLHDHDGPAQAACYNVTPAGIAAEGRAIGTIVVGVQRFVVTVVVGPSP
jgi:hypothetical protein